jgi:hypothetical protein
VQEEAMQLSPKVIAEKFNISLRIFEVDKNWNGYGSDRVARERKPRYDGTIDMLSQKSVFFVKNPLNEKIWTRAKEHFKSQYKHLRRCYVLSAVDVDKEIKVDEFAKYIHGPPEDRFLDVADLVKPERKKSQEKISILGIQQDPYNYKCTWQALNLQVADMDTAQTYYYVPIVGFAGSTKAGKHLDVKTVYSLMRRSKHEKLKTAKVYGVRAADIETVRGLANWVQLDTLVEEVLNSYTADSFLGLVLSWVDNDKEALYYSKSIMARLDPKSPIRTLHDKLPETPATGDREVFDLATHFDGEYNLKELEEKAKEELTALRERYPMFKLIRGRFFDDPAIIEYIQIVDKQKGLN